MAITEEFDRRLIGLAITYLGERHPLSWDRLGAQHNVSRSTFVRARRGDENVAGPALRRIEAVFELPYESLDLIGRHEFDQLRDDGVDRALVKWVESKATPRQSRPVAQDLDAETVKVRTRTRRQARN